MSGANSWLARQRKSDLVELAQTVGLTDFESLRKSELELTLDEYLSENATQFQSDPKLAPYFNSRARTAGSPIKREAPDTTLKVSRRRNTKAVEEIVAVDTPSSAEDSEPASDEAIVPASAVPSRLASSASNALVQTPGRALALAQRIPLPATPADVAHAVETGTVAVRERVSSLYQESGITEVTHSARDALSTITSILLVVTGFELYNLRPSVLPNAYVGTIPAINSLGTNDFQVYLPDMFRVLSSSFWYPVLTWLATSVVVPGVAGWIFNLSSAAASSQQASSGGRGRPAPRSHQVDYAVDPVTFSIVKALITYVVYAQGATFGGIISPETIARIDGAMYSGWRGVLAGTAITGITAVYDAVLKK